MSINGRSSLSSSQELSSSTASLSSSRQSSSHMSKVYKQASQLFLTRRLSEALSVTETVISLPPQHDSNGEYYEESARKAPIAAASPSQRIKIWSLYITLVNSICDLTDDEGRNEFGEQRFHDIGALVRDGNIWKRVIRDGYSGREGSVDAEVVYNLATLLLGQSMNQKVTQQRLETYLAASPDLDISGHLQRLPSRRNHSNGTNTPKDLSARVRIVELFTLHVLPRNEEWDYAREFISNSDILDEERREAFLQTLEELKDVQEPEDPTSNDLMDGRDESLKQEYEAQSRDTAAVAARQTSDAAIVPARRHQRSDSEVDYGIASPTGGSPPQTDQRPTEPAPQKPPSKILAPKQLPPVRSTPKAPLSKGKNNQATSPRSGKVSKKGNSGVFHQAQNLLRFLQNLVTNMAGNLANNPASLLKTLAFIVALLGVLSRGEVRERLRRALGGSWDKLKGTVGMGMKVSYM